MSSATSVAAVRDEAEEGVIIGKTYLKRPRWFRVLVGVPLIYVPILVTMPFVIIGVFFVRLHLRALGAHNMKGYWYFVPEWASHRYSLATQPRYNANIFAIVHYKTYWLFNCKLYCPLSVGMLRYFVYLVKIVENWWCPFDHSRKQDYADAAIDMSFWHIRDKPKAMLNPQDRDNPIWNNSARDAKGRSPAKSDSVPARARGRS